MNVYRSFFHTNIKRFLQWLQLLYNLTKITFLTFFYNEFADKYYIGDTFMEPMFWIVDHFTKILGPVCVAAVMILSTSIIVIAYVIGLPFYLEQHIFILSLALVIGHWLLVNVVFYYIMAFITEPGFPPQGAMITEAISICKRCIAPKPPRTHHCVVCNRCILKMDHHCPWLNNCIGHFNHRYFFMFCVYSWIGVVFLIIFGIPVAYDHFFNSVQPKSISSVVVDMVKTIGSYMPQKSSFILKEQSHNILSNTTDFRNSWPETIYHSCIIYAALLCVSVLFVLGGLIAWHARLICNGETSVEMHINKKETKRLLKEGQVYMNPYNLGAKKNWMLFLGVGYGRPWWNILFPFVQEPLGDGMQWNFFKNINWDHAISRKENSKTCFIKLA